MKLGNKHYKPHLNLGMKHYKNHLTLGMKHYGQDHHNSGHTHNTPDGIINNNSNSNEASKEPMTHTNFKPKKYIDNINHSNIEKARKKVHSENGDRNYA
jgi:hypothetical protein